MRLLAELKRRLFRWQSDGTVPLRLGQRRIFILPTRAGLLFAAALLAMLTGEIGIMRAMLLGPRSGLLSGAQMSAPQCDFTASVTTAMVNEPIQFTDLSTGGISEWYWAFGNGEGSTLLNPVYAYPEPGLYAVSLTVINELGNDFELKESYIEVSEAVGINLS